MVDLNIKERKPIPQREAPMGNINAEERKVAAKLQHHVIYVEDLERSADFYTRLFDLQFSAYNHPDSSAAMRLAQQQMRFFSFGFHHHDICLVKHLKLKMDNGSMMHFALAVRDGEAFDAVRRRAAEMGVEAREGRLIASARLEPGSRAFHLRDPNNHWIEIIEEPSQ
jgi:catechol 2,3-dioxygenase-like lactoylglutathione lyase family enzyme